MKLIESDIVANGIKLHVYRSNTDKPPLLFAHGMSDNGLCFWPVAEQFAAEYEIILYDSRNHGQSEAAQPGSPLVERAHDLAGLVDALELNKPKMIGHSLGAVTVALYAGLHPHGPGCVVLEDPPPFERMAARNTQSTDFEMEWRELAAADKEKSIAELLEMNREENPTWPEAERSSWAQSKQQFNLNAFDEGDIEVELGKQIISQISCPLLIITADLDKNAIYPPQAADELVAELPNARHVNIPGAGHNIRREQPEAFLTAVRDFLKSY